MQSLQFQSVHNSCEKWVDLTACAVQEFIGVELLEGFCTLLLEVGLERHDRFTNLPLGEL